MRLQQAIKKAKKLKCKIRNNELRMEEQTAKSLMYWLFIDTNNETQTYNQFDKLMTSTKWELVN